MNIDTGYFLSKPFIIPAIHIRENQHILQNHNNQVKRQNRRDVYKYLDLEFVITYIYTKPG